MPISYTWKLIKCILQCVPKHNKMFAFLHTPVVDFGSHLLSTGEYWIQFWTHHYMHLLKSSQCRVTKWWREWSTNPTKKGRELGPFSLKKRLGRILSKFINTWWEGAKAMELGLFQWCQVQGQESIGTNWNTGCSVYIWRNTSLLCGWQSTGTGCSVRLWRLLLQKIFKRATWTWSWASCSWYPCLSRDWIRWLPEII